MYVVLAFRAVNIKLSSPAAVYYQYKIQLFIVIPIIPALLDSWCLTLPVTDAVEWTHASLTIGYWMHFYYLQYWCLRGKFNCYLPTRGLW